LEVKKVRGSPKLIERHAGPHAIVDIFRGHFDGDNLACSATI